MFALDTETHPFSPGCMAPRIVCLSWCSGGVPSLAVGWEPQAEAWLEAVLTSQSILVGHNMAYDMTCAMAMWPDLTPAVFEAYAADRVTDTGIRQKLLDIARGCYRGFRGPEGGYTKISYHLADLSQRLLGRHLEKEDTWRLRYAELDGVPLDQWPPEAWDYALGDAVTTWQVAEAQEHDAKDMPGVLDDQYRQTRKALALHLASAWGIVTDAKALDALARATSAKIDEHLVELQAAGIIRANGSRDMKRVYALVEKADPRCKRTATGRPATDAESLAKSPDPVIRTLSGYGAAASLLTGAIGDLRRGTTAPIHTYFEPLLETGRTSSSGPNIQNMRRAPGIRECVVPRPGFLFAACDFDKAELHTLAEVCYQVLGYSALGEALNGGFDPHLSVGAQLLGITYAEALERKHEPLVKEARQRAKPANFGFPGGMGAKGFLEYAQSTYGMAFTLDQATALRQTWLDTWPEMVEYFAWIQSLLAKSELYTARQLTSNRYRGMCSYTVLANTFFQGLCADGAGAALFAVAREEYADPESPLYGCRTVNFIHDELLVEVPDEPEMASAAAHRLRDVMIEAFNVWVPHVPVRASVALMRRWIKGAEAVYRGGLLVPAEETR